MSTGRELEGFYLTLTLEQKLMATENLLSLQKRSVIFSNPQLIPKNGILPQPIFAVSFVPHPRNHLLAPWHTI